MAFWNYRRGQASASIPARMLQHAGDTATCGTFTPEDGGPMALILGAQAPRDAVQRLAARHGLQAEDLMKFKAQGAS